MKVMMVVGARPNFMKVAPILNAIRSHNAQKQEEEISYVLVHTGQHYDQTMSGSFFADLNLPKPDIHLAVGSGSHAAQTAEIMRRFEDVLLKEEPQVLLVAGDVNSTVACALVAAKVSYAGSGLRPQIAHVEAGLRSFDRTMPEEINRILTDALSDLLFVTEQSGIDNLAREGIPTAKIHFVGNTMIDSLLAFKDKAEMSSILDYLGLRARDGGREPVAHYALLTLHRPANVDRKDSFLDILEGLDELSMECPIVFPVHPRTRGRIAEFGLESYFKSGTTHPQQNGIRLTDPLGYLDFLCLLKHAKMVVTDSGGIQEETTCLGIPCVTVRENTERPVTLAGGANILAGVRKEGIRDAARRQFGRTAAAVIPPKWDGQASSRIVKTLLAHSPNRVPSAV
jgi:UDP-N-acetylglucosamine 2-epimerase (non-hydrolysing)